MNAAQLDQDLFQAAVAAMPEDSLSGIRKAAAIRFAEMGFPDTSDEDWKYTNLAPAAEILNAAMIAPARDTARSAAFDARIAAVRSAIDAHWLVIRNGMVEMEDVAELRAKLGGGIGVLRLTDAPSPGLDNGEDPLALFNAALLRDGLHIVAGDKSTASKPLGIMIVDDAAARSSQVRIEIQLAASAELRVVEFAMSENGSERFTNAVVNAELDDGARLDYVRIQDRGKGHVSVNTSRTRIGRDASFRHNNFDFGGALTRNSLAAEITGAGADVRLHGLYLASGRQHIDNHTSVVHAVGPATSFEEYRGILNGRARGVFNSKAIVASGADGTDASQSNHNLLLSDKAEIDTKPELEIYADEVKCSHGATVGQLDTNALFYLRARGLDKGEAARILTGAFAAQTLDALVIDECHDYLQDKLIERLEELVDDRDE